MERGDRIFSLIREEKRHICLVVLKERFCKNRWALGFHQNVETCLKVGITIRVIRSDRLLVSSIFSSFLEQWENILILCQSDIGSIVKIRSQEISFGLPWRSVCTPSSSTESGAIASRVALYGNNDHIVCTEFSTPFIYSPGTFSQGNICCFGHQDSSIKASGFKIRNHPGSDFTSIGVFTEGKIWRMFPSGVGAMPIIN